MSGIEPMSAARNPWTQNEIYGPPARHLAGASAPFENNGDLPVWLFWKSIDDRENSALSYRASNLIRNAVNA